MINILNDIQGVTGTNIVVPFALDSTNLPYASFTVELIGKKSTGYETLPKGLVFAVRDGDTEEAINNISPVEFDTLFVARISTTTHDISELYIRIYNDNVSYLSQKIIISKDLDIEFTTAPKELAFRPKCIKLSDNVQCTYNGTVTGLTKDKFDIQISISNNATSTALVWEDVTDAYLAGQSLAFANTTKDSNKTWAVSVKYKIHKTIGNSTVQVSNIAMLVL